MYHAALPTIVLNTSTRSSPVLFGDGVATGTLQVGGTGAVVDSKGVLAYDSGRDQSNGTIERLSGLFILGRGQFWKY